MIENNTYRFLNGLQSLGWKLGLNNITELVDYLGNPHVEQKYVHIAGTNGKGSTAAMLESILRAGGYKTGLFTSPHLIDVRERIKCNGENIPMTKLVAYVDELKSFVIAKGCTYFETTTAIALKYFSDCCVDFAVIEVGMGGRFDATNIITPLLSIITEIDFDHTEHLGKDYYSIAKEKAGIIKQDIPCLVQSRNQEALRAIAEVAQSKQSKLFKLSDMITVKDYQLFETFSKADLNINESTFENLNINIPGHKQIYNAALALSAVYILKKHKCHIPTKSIYAGLRTTYWPGRLEKLQDNPKIVVDVAHNHQAVDNLFNDITSIFNYKRLIVLVGFLRDKNVSDMAKLISEYADYVFVTTPNSDRALNGDSLVQEFLKNSITAINIDKEYKAVLNFAKSDDLVCVTGSFYVVGDFLNFYKKA